MAQKKKAAKKAVSKTTKKVSKATKKVTKKSGVKKVAKKTATKKTTSKKIKPPAELPKLKASLIGKSFQTTGGDASLKDYQGKYLVVYFYPKDSTPGCTTEGRDFTAAIDRFKRAGATVLGVSRDSIKSHEKFKEKQGFKFELLSDPTEEFCKAFGVIKLKKLYGREFMGVDRSTFILDKTSKPVAAWRGVKVAGHVDEVLEKLKSL